MAMPTTTPTVTPTIMSTTMPTTMHTTMLNGYATRLRHQITFMAFCTHKRCHWDLRGL